MSPEKEKPGPSGPAAWIGAFIAAWILALYKFRQVQPVLHLFWIHHWLQVIVIAVIVSLIAIVVGVIFIFNRRVDASYDEMVTAEDQNAVHLGRDENDRAIYLKQQFRTTHTQVIGTTSAGKTESVILPWAIHDIEKGSGLIIIDGKSDKSFLEKLYGYVERAGRTSDFRLFSLAAVDPSSTFNPLVGGSPEEVAERVFSSFNFENEYYKNIQYKIFLSLIRLICSQNRVPTFALVQRLMTDMEALKPWVDHCNDENLKRELELFQKLPEKDRLERVNGLDASLSHFTGGQTAVLFNSERPQIDLSQVLRWNRICYFQLPTMYLPVLGQVTGKLVLQCFQSEVAKRHLGMAQRPGFFSCYLDDFQDYIYKGFGSLLNKSRSANVAVVFSHQALGDLDNVDAAFRNVVLTNTNVKIVMRNNNPETCDYFAASFGTRAAQKITERQKKEIIGTQKTGEGSVRDVEEYIFHPNQIRQLGTGYGVVSIPHPEGVKSIKVKFSRRADIAGVKLPVVPKESRGLSEAILPPITNDVVEYRVA